MDHGLESIIPHLEIVDRTIHIRHRASVHEVGVWLPEAVFSYRKHSTGTIGEVAEPLLRISH